jgi:hypothetical protein
MSSVRRSRRSVVPAERHDAALAGVALKLEVLERQRAHLVEQRALLVRRDEAGLVAESRRERGRRLAEHAELVGHVGVQCSQRAAESTGRTGRGTFGSPENGG